MAARWPLGIGLTSWRYMWRTTPLHRDEVGGNLADNRPPPLEAGVSDELIQPYEVGAGPLFHRSYRTRIRESRLTPSELVERVAADPDRVVPTEFASFQKVLGADEQMLVGDEYVVRMAAPWDGPVRVVKREPQLFRLATLEQHLEAGQIEFRAFEEGELLIFEIESWARSKDWITDILYDRLRMSKEVQLHMWTSVLERVVELSGGRMTGGVDIHTVKIDAATLAPRRPAGDAPSGGDPPWLPRPGRVPSQLARLAELPFNFDRERIDEVIGDPWLIDDYTHGLPDEPPGEPLPDGSFAVAKRVLADYDFTDRRQVRAFYRAGEPLEGRDMLLELRYLFVRIRIGVRVGEVIDERREVGGRPVAVWGAGYGTLRGHVERGWIDYELWKWLDSGRVEFRIRAVSQIAEIRNPILRLGFGVVGRRQQIRFARRCGERMAALVARRLAQGPNAAPPADPGDGIRASPAE